MLRFLSRCFLLLAAGAAAADVVDVRQGTNISLAVSPDKQTIVVDLLGGLWTLPATGGGATLVIPLQSGVSQPRFDPAGERVVFQRWQAGQWDVWILTLADGSFSPLTETAFDEREPEFSPDGREVVFASNRSGEYEIWALELATGGLRQLTDEPGDSRFPSYSDAGELAYVHQLGGRSAIRILGGGLRGRTLVESNDRLDAPSWRPGGGVLVFNERSTGISSDLAMYVEADEPIRRPLTEAEDVFVGRAAWLSPAEYLYAADGQIWRRRIASTERTPVHLIAAVSTESAPPISSTARPDAPGPHRAAGINGLVREPASGRIAFSALGDLWVADGEDLERLTDDAATDAWPEFTPDGESLLFASDRGGDMEIWRIALATGRLLQVSTEIGRSFQPRVSADGRFVAFLETVGFGPWDGANLRLIALDRPFASTLLASGLIDAGDLAWTGSRIMLRARERAGAERSERGFDTAAADLPGTPSEGPVELALPADVWPSYTTAAADAPLVIQAGRVFDGIGDSYDYLVDIHIEGQRIRDVVRRGLLPLPERVIDGSSLTVLPGLIDVHTHIAAISGAEAGRLLLRHGVTTVRSAPDDVAAAVERAEIWAAGRQPGPRLVIDAMMLPDVVTLPANSPVIVSNGHMARSLAHSLAEQRAQNGNNLSPLPPILAVSGDQALPALTVSMLGQSYQDVIGNLDASGRWLPTSLVAAGLGDDGTAISGLATTIARVMRSSGRVAIGSDAPAVPYGQGFHDELVLLAEQDIPNDQILRWATAGGAIALGLSLDLGTVEPGRLADFVIVDGDPLQQIADLNRIVAVVRGGVWLDVGSLEASD